MTSSSMRATRIFATPCAVPRPVKEKSIHFIDCGTSGGIGGEAEGYCLMVGGDAEAVERVRPMFEALAAPGGYLHVGQVGSGHYTKMVHNAIEYGILQAIGEGFELLRAAPYAINVADVAQLWTKAASFAAGSWSWRRTLCRKTRS